MQLRKFFFFTICAISSVSLFAQKVSVQTKLDRHEIKTGEQAVLDFTIRTDDLTNTQLLLPADSLGGTRFEVLSTIFTDTLDIDDHIKEIKGRCLITSFDSTLVTIPPMIVQTPTAQAESQPLALNVVQPEVDLSKPDEFFDIKTPWKLPYTLRDILIIVYSNPISWLLMFIMLLFIIWLETKFKFRKKDRNAVAVPQIRLSPKEEAEANLAALDKLKLPEQGQYKLFYSNLVEILKTYIYREKALHVQEMTSSEVVDTLKRNAEPEKLITSIRSIFFIADMAKFAKYKPLPDEHYRSMQEAYAFLNLADTTWSRHEGGEENKNLTEKVEAEL